MTRTSAAMERLKRDLTSARDAEGRETREAPLSRPQFFMALERLGQHVDSELQVLREEQFVTRRLILEATMLNQIISVTQCIIAVSAFVLMIFIYFRL